MAIKTTGASIITSKSAISSGLVIVNRPEGYFITGPRVEAGTTFKKLVVTPGSPDNVEDITGGGGTAPTITSIVVTDASWVPTGLNVIDSDLGGFIEINGTNFDSGAIVYLNGEALTTTFVDSTKLRVVVPPTTAGVYAIMLFNSDDFGTIFTNLTLSIAPTFITPAGSLGSFYETLPVVANVSANADSNVTYAVFSGSFPAGLTLVSGNGNITGNAPPVSSETNYPFVVSATDEEFQASTRSFSMTILPDLVTWIVLSDFDDFILVNNEPIASITLNASAISGQSISYTANILPEGLTIVGSAVTGTPLAEGNTNTRLTATAASTTKTGNVDVLFKIRDRWKVNNYGLINSSNCILHGSLTPANSADDIFIDSSGRHFFTINSSNDRIYQFFLTKPWSIKTATYVANISVASFDSTPLGIDFKPDGTKMFISGLTGDRIYEFALPTAWDITSATNIGNVLLTSLSTFSTGPYQLRFHSDGTKFYVNDGSLSLTRIYQFNLSVPWQANTASNVKLGTSTDYYTIPATGADGSMRGIDFSSDFSKFYGSFGTQANIIAEFDLQTPGQANNMSLVAVYNHSLYPKYSNETWYNIEGPIRLKPDGTKMYKGIRGSNFVTELSLPTPYSVTTVSIDRDVKGFLYIAGLEIEPTGMYITPDGTKLFFIGSTLGSLQKDVFEVSLSVPYDIASGIAISNSLGSYQPEISTNITGIEFKPDGTKMFLCETSTDKVFEFKLNTAWASNSAVRIGNITVSDNPEGVIFKPDGTKMFVCNNAADRLTEWALSTPWQVNTAVEIGLLSISAIESSPVEFAFKPDGNVFYLIGSGGDRINQFNLSTPWQVNTAVYVSNISIANFESLSESIRITNDGNYIYFLGQNRDYIWQFGLN
jgi:sugar lactone lactonase YvrE